jgi:hypothetical protein
LIYGDENHIFTVDIVGDLKKAVLDHRAVDELVLWKDSDDRLEEELGENPFNGGRFMELLPLDDLAEVFVDQPHQLVHSSALAHFPPLPLGTITDSV